MNHSSKIGGDPKAGDASTTSPDLLKNIQTREIAIVKNIFSIPQPSEFFKTAERADMWQVIVDSEFLTFWEVQ